MKVRGSSFFASVWACGLWLSGAEAMSQESTKLYRVPFRVEDSVVMSSMALEVRSHQVEETYLAFRQSVADPVEGALVGLFDALQAGDVNRVVSLVQEKPFLDPEARSQLAQGYIEGFREVWPSLRIVKRMDWGREQAFVWEVVMGGQPFRRIFRLSSEAMAGQSGYWLDEMNPQGVSAVKNVLAEVEQFEAMGQGVEWAGGDSFRFRSEVLDYGMAWRFNGFGCDFNAFAASAQVPNHPVTRFFYESSRALASGDAAAYGAYFAAYSRAKLEPWMNGLRPEEYQAYVQDRVQQGRKVTFVVTAAPVYLVYYETTDGRHPYELIWDSGEGLRLVNFFIEGLVDDILKDESFFYGPVLRSLGGRVEEPPVEVASAPGATTNRNGAISAGAGVAGVGTLLTSAPNDTVSTNPPSPSQNGPGTRSTHSLGTRKTLLLVLLAIGFGIFLSWFLKGKR